MTGSSERCVRIYIAGAPFSGKTETGGIVAGRLGLHFIDLDDAIQRMEGCDIPDIFRRFGEARFRTLESLHLNSFAASGKSFLMSLGGGCLLAPANLRTVLSTGTLITLLASIGTLLSRASASEGSVRPLAPDLDELRSLLIARDGHYCGLPNGIDTGGMSVEEAADAVMAKLDELAQSSE